MGVGELFAKASEETQRLVLDLLEQDATDRAWGEQIGPALTQADTARLLGKSEQAVAKDRRLLRIKTRSGRVAYPVIQFDGRRPVPGIGDVVQILDEVADALTIAAWLTGAHLALDDSRPIDVLRDRQTDAVLTAARRFARQAAA